MEMNDLILISTDDHICEPPNVFDNAPGKFRDRMPKVTTDENGIDAWTFNGRRAPNLGLNAVVGRRRDEYGVEPTAFSEMRKGTYDVDARVGDMSVDGVLGSLNFPQMAGLFGQAFIDKSDLDMSLLCYQAYNDWHIDEWCGAYPGRFIPAAIVPPWDMKLAVAEIRRVNAKGCNAIHALPVPNREGFPSWNTDYWNPMLAACDELGVVINLHINDAVNATPSPESPVDVFVTNMAVTLFCTASDILWSPILRKFPNIKFALSEGGSGWVPYWKEKVDFTYTHHHQWTHQDFGGRLPSELFEKHFFTCFIQDNTAIAQRDKIGINNMTWESDYPHSDCNWPNSAEETWKQVKVMSDEEINKVTHLNAMRLYRFDPFKHIKREDATVGALRVQAKKMGVDMSFLDRPAKIQPTNERGRVPTMGDMQKRLAEAYSTTG